jgi:hypothetical protein
VENNHFLLSVSDQAQVVFKDRVSLPNFFVGLLVLTWITERLKQDLLPGPDAAQPAPRPTLPAAAEQRVKSDERGAGGVMRPG